MTFIDRARAFIGRADPVPPKWPPDQLSLRSRAVFVRDFRWIKIQPRALLTLIDVRSYVRWLAHAASI
jgi:hypothetical protein